MSKRNFILLIVILTTLTVIILGYLYLYQPTGNQTGEGTNFLSQFNPFGSSQPQTPPTTPNENLPGLTPQEPEPETSKLTLSKVSSMGIAGYGLFKRERFTDVPVVTPAMSTEMAGEAPTTSTTPTPPPTEFITAVRYVARSTGNIYQTFADRLEERKFSNTTIPRVYEAFFGNKGDSVIMRYLNADDITIETFVGNLPKEVLGGDTSSENEVRGIFLPQNIRDVSVSPDGLKLLYLYEVGESIVGTTHDLLDGKKVQIFDSPFTEWLTLWPTNKMMTLTTKPSGLAQGYMYAIDPNVKRFTKILGGINGLTTLTSPDGKWVLYSSNDLSLSIYDVTTKTFSSLGLRTLPEKCAWDSKSLLVYCAVPKSISSLVYPDSWYKGETSFSDDLWRINMEDRSTSMLVDITLNSGEDVDGVKLSLDEEGKYLFFINKKDSILWKLNLE